MRVFEKVLKSLCVVLFVEMAIVTFMQVVSRYIFGASFFWAEELARFSMVWIAFLGAAIAIAHNSHTNINFFVNLLPKTIKKYVEIAQDLACLFFVVCVIFYSWPIVSITMKNLSTGLKIPMGLVYISLPVSGFIMILYLLLRLYFKFTTRGKSIGGEQL